MSEAVRSAVDHFSNKQKLPKYKVTAKSCPVRSVTVFRDRAEVNRVVDVDIIPGNMKVVISELSACAMEDSVRVTCFGEAIIVEVQFKSKAVSETKEPEGEKETSEFEHEKLRKQLIRLEKEKSILLEERKLLEQERMHLEKFSLAIFQITDRDRIVDVVADGTVSNFFSYTEKFSERSGAISAKLFALNEKVEKLDAEIRVLQANQNQLPRMLCFGGFKTTRRVSVLLESSVKAQIKLVVSYVVTDSSWMPLYDVRAFNKDSSLQIMYFATIRQNTGEDWENAKVSLSTAMPSVGGSPPELSPQLLDLANAVHVQTIMRKQQFRGLAFGASASAPPAAPVPGGIFGQPMILTRSQVVLEEADLPEAEATEGITSTSFEIARPATIKSDNVGHKVSICQLDFKPEFEYFATPKAVAHAFLKVKAKNDSPYALLAGPVNVFLDNNFLTKSSLPAVSPSENFEIALGVDPLIKVTYKPLRKFEQTTGILSKSTNFNFLQEIVVKNTKQVAVKIIITDQFPRSSNEKIKVLLQEPDVKMPKPGSGSEPAFVETSDQKTKVYTRDSKVEWELNIPAAEERKISLLYQVEYPLGERITGLDVVHIKHS